MELREIWETVVEKKQMQRVEVRESLAMFNEEKTNVLHIYADHLIIHLEL
jgi:hypothetical protein